MTKLNTKSRITLTKFRASNNRLPVTVGRYQNIDRDERFCDKCNSGAVGDEYHVLLDCSNQEISQARDKYLPSFFRCQPSREKFIMLMQTKNIALMYKLVTFLNVIFKIFR